MLLYVLVDDYVFTIDDCQYVSGELDSKPINVSYKHNSYHTQGPVTYSPFKLEIEQTDLHTIKYLKKWVDTTFEISSTSGKTHRRNVIVTDFKSMLHDYTASFPSSIEHTNDPLTIEVQYGIKYDYSYDELMKEKKFGILKQLFREKRLSDLLDEDLRPK